MIISDWLEYARAEYQSWQVKRTDEQPAPFLTANLYPKPIIFDVYEGSLEIDETELSGHVKGLAIRINDIRGGHHKDENFDKQWKEAEGFYRAPYFVYNPWKSGADNFSWLIPNCPETKIICVDAEVKKLLYAPKTYAKEFDVFYRKCQAAFGKVLIYTAEWFLPFLSAWPNGEYWWAQYLKVVYPPARVNVTWAQLETMLAPLSIPSNGNKCPGKIVMWQCSGDRLQVPGTQRAIDVNLWLKPAADLDAYFLKPNATEPPPDVPPVEPPKPPVVALDTTNLYYVDARKWTATHEGQKPPAGGPLTQPMTSTWGKLGANRVLLTKQWQDYIARWNTPADFERICSKDFGPTFGRNDKGLLIYLGLAWPGPCAMSPRPNMVKVVKIKGAWAQIESLMTDWFPGVDVTPATKPWLFHHVYGSSNDAGKYSVLSHTYTIPLIAAAGLPWWIPTAALTKV
jgi:hypothetical protein